MELTKTDADLLEFVTLSEPWSMVCGEFCPKYGSIEAFVARLTTFEHAEFIVIEPESGAPDATAQALWQDAVAHGFYDEVVVSDGPSWNITATDDGFAAIRDRFSEQ